MREIERSLFDFSITPVIMRLYPNRLSCTAMIALSKQNTDQRYTAKRMRSWNKL